MAVRFIFILLALFSCNYYDHDFPYHLKEPEQVIDLPDELQEISGLDFKDENTMYALHDEAGEIFEIKLPEGTITSIIKFAPKGDFEGLASAGQLFYAIESNGILHRVGLDGSHRSFKLPEKYHEKVEVEGLCYEKDKQRLLIACKDHKLKEYDDEIIILEFSLADEKIKDEPVYRWEKNKIHPKFKPSGISLNENGNIVVISAGSYAMIEVDTEGTVLHKAFLNYWVYPQIEGICFSPTGTLYLANEKSNQDGAKIIKLPKHD
jgi:uncharacterized protein YjiK